MLLENRNAVIYGAGGNIGRAVSKGFAAQGAPPPGGLAEAVSDAAGPDCRVCRVPSSRAPRRPPPWQPRVGRGRRPRATPGFFSRLAAQQAPHYLWIGCSDSRVPANEIVGLLPGRAVRAPQRRQRGRAHRSELPVGAAVRGRRAEGRARHRLRPLRLRRRAGGAATTTRLGLIDNWLRHVQDVARKHAAELDGDCRRATRASTGCASSTSSSRSRTSARRPIVQDAWARGQELTVHGWIYGLDDGLLRDLGVTTSAADEIDLRRADTVARLAAAV